MESQKRRKSLSPSPNPSPKTLQPTFHQFDISSGGIETNNTFKELGASCNSSVADVEVKISGPNVILRVISQRIPGQVSRIITVLESFSFEVLHLNISSMEETVLYQFVVKVNHTTTIMHFYLDTSHQTLICFVDFVNTDRTGMSAKFGGTSYESSTKLLFRGYEVDCCVTIFHFKERHVRFRIVHVIIK